MLGYKNPTPWEWIAPKDPRWQLVICVEANLLLNEKLSYIFKNMFQNPRSHPLGAP